MSGTKTGPESVIRTRGLSKRYGSVLAVDKVDLDVRHGEIYGFLGLNGAGKTTTIRMLLGLIWPTEGEFSVFGLSLRRHRRELLGRIGFLVESATAYPNLTVRENLELQRRLVGAGRGAVDEVVELLGLSEYADRRAGRLSLGNKQRLGLARSLVHSPELLILDEPANGLDPAGIVEIRGLLRALAEERGITIFMSSHHLSEVDRLADRIGIVHRGRLVEELGSEALRAELRARLELSVDDGERAERLLRERLGPGGLVQRDGNELTIGDPKAVPEAVARILAGEGIALRRLVRVEENLEAHFMRVTGGEG